MQVSPINNTNINGHFLKTTELEKLLKCSDKNTLYRFNDVLEQASKVNDGKIFKISASVDSRLESWGKKSSFHFHLLSYPEDDEYNTMIEDKKSFEHNHFSDSKVLWDKYATVLKNFLATLEKIYPKTEFNESYKELIEKINNKLI